MKRFVALLILLPLPMLVGCGSSKPTDSDCKKIVEEQISKDGSGILILVSFHKTNGVAGNKDGVQTYNMEYECEVEATTDCTIGNGFGAVPNAVYPNCKKGSRKKILGEVDFVKKENGWTQEAALDAGLAGH